MNTDEWLQIPFTVRKLINSMLSAISDFNHTLSNIHSGVNVVLSRTNMTCTTLSLQMMINRHTLKVCRAFLYQRRFSIIFKENFLHCFIITHFKRISSVKLKFRIPSEIWKINTIYTKRIHWEFTLKFILKTLKNWEGKVFYQYTPLST